MGRNWTFAAVAILLVAAGGVQSLEIVKRCNMPGYARTISGPHQSVLGRFLVVACDSAGVVKLLPYGDVADSVFCERLTTYPTKGCALDVAADGWPRSPREMFVADGDSGLQVYLADSGTAWMGPAGFAVPGVSRTAIRLDSTVFVAGDSGLFAFVRASGDYWRWDSLSVAFSERIWCLGAEDIAAEGHYVYVLAGAGGRIVKLNVERPESAIVELVVPTHYDTCALAVLHDTAYVVTYNWFPVYAMDTTGRPPGAVEWWHSPVTWRWLYGHGEAITLSGDRAYISVSSFTTPEHNAVYVYDIANRTAPVLVDSLRDFPGTPGGIAVDGDYVYVAAGDSGLVVLSQAPLAARPSVHAPMRTAARVELLREARGLVFRLACAGASPVAGSVVGLDGRVVARLAWQRGAAGTWSARWDAPAQTGGSGVYCVAVLLENGAVVTSHRAAIGLR